MNFDHNAHAQDLVPMRQLGPSPGLATVRLLLPMACSRWPCSPWSVQNLGSRLLGPTANLLQRMHAGKPQSGKCVWHMSCSSSRVSLLQQCIYMLPQLLCCIAAQVRMQPTPHSCSLPTLACNMSSPNTSTAHCLLHVSPGIGIGIVAKFMRPSSQQLRTSMNA